MEQQKRFLIFIVAFNAEAKIEMVLQRIPQEFLRNHDYEILIIDDNSKDSTFSVANRFKKANLHLNITILYNPENQGYGGNQKLGYRYAIINKFDYVVLLHGDGQYAPEILPNMVAPFSDIDVSAVFGSRMINKQDAINGGMPYYKFIGNQILTKIQNFILGSSLSEFHSGYRAYSVKWLESIPFEFNSNDFDFDTQIIIQLIGTKSRIVEIPIPTYYGDEICHVNGYKYAFDILIDTFQYKLHSLNIYYKREYDLPKNEPLYTLKMNYASSHRMAYNLIGNNSKVLDIGCGPGLFAKELKKKNCFITGIDMQELDDISMFDNYHKANIENIELLNNRIDKYDYILLLDIIEHLKRPEEFLLKLRSQVTDKKVKVIITTPNIAFFVVRISLLFGKFNYGKKGILDLTHTRLFTFSTLKSILHQTGYVITEVKGIPAPYPAAIGENLISNLLLKVNRFLNIFVKTIFAYQILVVAEIKPAVENILKKTIQHTEELV